MHRIAKWLKARRRTYAFLYEYFGAIAQQWQDLLWGPGVLAVVWGIWFIAGNPPSWINWSAIVLALFLAGYYVWRADHIRLIPGLEFGDTRVVPTATMNLQTGQPGAKRVVGQVLVRLCSPDAHVTNARGQLLRVWKWSDGKHDWTLTNADEPQDLLWSVIDQPIKMLDTDRQLCVFSIDEDNIHINIWTSRHVFRMDDVFKDSKPNDIFKFDISLAGENCPAICASFKVQIGELWDQPIFEPISQERHSMPSGVR